LGVREPDDFEHAFAEMTRGHLWGAEWPARPAVWHQELLGRPNGFPKRSPPDHSRCIMRVPETPPEPPFVTVRIRAGFPSARRTRRKASAD
jgi:hypothetical protein